MLIRILKWDLFRAYPEAPAAEEGEEHVGGGAGAALRWREDIHHVGPDWRRHRQAHIRLTQPSGLTNSSPSSGFRGDLL